MVVFFVVVVLPVAGFFVVVVVVVLEVWPKPTAPMASASTNVAIRFMFWHLPFCD